MANLEIFYRKGKEGGKKTPLTFPPITDILIYFFVLVAVLCFLAFCVVTGLLRFAY